jgi:hypothetical protein
MTEAIKKQEKVFKKLFIFLSAALALVFLTAILPPCDSKLKCKNESTVNKIEPVREMCNEEYNLKPSGCIFRDYLLPDHLFG